MRLRDLIDWLLSIVRTDPSPSPNPAPTPVPQPLPTPSDPVAASMGRELLEKANAARATYGMLPISTESRLMAEAIQHAAWMASTGRLDHFSPRGGPGPRIRERGYDYSSCAENIAAGQKTPALTIAAWLNSPPHRDNLLATWPNFGAGCAKASNGQWYWCMIFGHQSSELQVLWPVAWYTPGGVDDRK